MCLSDEQYWGLKKRTKFLPEDRAEEKAEIDMIKRSFSHPTSRANERKVTLPTARRKQCPLDI